MSLGPFRISARTERWNVFTCLVFAAICAGIVALVAVCTPLDSLWWDGICTVLRAMAEPEIARLRPTQQLGVYLVGLLFLAFLFLAALMTVLLPAVAAMVWITRRTSPRADGRSRGRR
ncbi:MAG: hypothetical protein GXX96_24680 [Planctomycetaceae bacterium]|nr:hypothetical protein [Planctomycetaceae bacterium]